jgi:hypothetical protein
MSVTGERPLSVWSAPSWGHPVLQSRFVTWRPVDLGVPGSGQGVGKVILPVTGKVATRS